MRRWAPTLLVAVLVSSVGSGAAASPEREQARTHYRAALQSLDAGRLEDAVSHFEKAYAASPDPAVLFNIGQAYALLGRHQKALDALNRFLEAAPDSQYAAAARTLVEQVQHDRSGQEAASERASAREHYQAALQLLHAGRLEDALEKFQMAYAASPNPVVLFNIGQAYALLERLPEALEALEQYLDADPESPDAPTARRMIERMYRKVGRLEVSTVPEDAALWIDGTRRERASGKSRHYLSPAEHTIAVRKDGYEPFERTIRLAPGERHRTRVELTRIATLMTACALPGVRTRVDRKPWSTPPKTARPIAEGDHTVEFERTGYATDRQRFSVEPGGESVVTCQMRKLEEAALTASPAPPPRDAPNRPLLRRNAGIALVASGAALEIGALGLLIWNNKRYSTWRTEEAALDRILDVGPPYPSNAQSRQSQNVALLDSIQTVDAVTIASASAGLALLAAGGTLWFAGARARPSVTAGRQGAMFQLVGTLR